MDTARGRTVLLVQGNPQRVSCLSWCLDPDAQTTPTETLVEQMSEFASSDVVCLFSEGKNFFFFSHLAFFSQTSLRMMYMSVLILAFFLAYAVDCEVYCYVCVTRIHLCMVFFKKTFSGSLYFLHFSAHNLFGTQLYQWI